MHARTRGLRGCRELPPTGGIQHARGALTELSTNGRRQTRSIRPQGCQSLYPHAAVCAMHLGPGTVTIGSISHACAPSCMAGLAGIHCLCGEEALPQGGMQRRTLAASNSLSKVRLSTTSTEVLRSLGRHAPQHQCAAKQRITTDPDRRACAHGALATHVLSGKPTVRPSASKLAWFVPV